MAAVTSPAEAEVAEIDEPAGSNEPERPADGRRGPATSTLAGAAFCLWGVLIGLRSLHDNSFLTHLATGRIIVRTWHIPRHDIYSFTAHGDPWVVQSWLASVAYGLADKFVGLGGIRMMDAAMTLLIAAIVWRLTGPARSLVSRIAIAGLVLGVGSGMWVERPLLMGLSCFALLLYLVEGDGDLRWLVPIMWVWVNTHGSFPLGIAYLGVLAVGARLDGDRSTRVVKALGWTVAGTLLGALNPLGFKLLLFPLTVLHKSKSFSVIKEWRPPTFTDPWQLIFLAQFAIAVLLVARTRRWRTFLPLALFAVLAFTSARNIVVASLIFVPGMAVSAQALGSITGANRPRLGRAVLAVIVALGLVIGVSDLMQPNATLTAYPEHAVTWLQDRHLLNDRVVAPDYVGNYLEARYGGAVQVFIDDRVDMYPTQVVMDSVTLLGGGPKSMAVLRKYRAGVVIWQTGKPLTARLRKSPDWRVGYQDKSWVVFLPAHSAT